MRQRESELPSSKQMGRQENKLEQPDKGGGRSLVEKRRHARQHAPPLPSLSTLVPHPHTSSSTHPPSLPIHTSSSTPPPPLFIHTTTPSLSTPSLPPPHHPLMTNSTMTRHSFWGYLHLFPRMMPCLSRQSSSAGETAEKTRLCEL